MDPDHRDLPGLQFCVDEMVGHLDHFRSCSRGMGISHGSKTVEFYGNGQKNTEKAAKDLQRIDVLRGAYFT